MIEFLKELFNENGRVSMMRLMSLLSLFAGIAVAIIGMNKPVVDYSGISLVASVFLSAAFGGKVLQKRIEVDGAKAETEITERGPSSRK